ncbi:MAG: hypothetical protein QMC95_12775 [Desulfitobacteriaceae bacterium]|nr:hypothetical protein [Desulfitobacteriaceae bacterium]MDI6915072.1 hypothetical protein [Desulfitobacteriaceae bacterium]
MKQQIAGLTQEPLNLGLVIFAPVSSVTGSATVFYLQPLLTSKVFAASGVLIGAELFLLLAQKLFGLEGVPLRYGDAEGGLQRVTIPVAELRNFLQTIAGSDGARIRQGGVSSEFLTPKIPEAPLIVGIAAYADYSSEPFAPIVFFAIPIFTLPGVRGSLPLLILITLTTIFVRAVVPPSTTGSRPLSDPKPEPIQFQAEDILQMLRKFRKNFAN